MKRFVNGDQEWTAEPSGWSRDVGGLRSIGVWFVSSGGQRVYGSVSPVGIDKMTVEQLAEALRDALSRLCPLCGEPAELAWQNGSDTCAVTCSRCVGFTVTARFVDECEQARAKGNVAFLDGLSDRAAATRVQGGNLNLDVSDR
jgi:hypothetical protein